MQAEVGARSGDVCSKGEKEMTTMRELYGLAWTLLPSALVMALAEPLMLLPEPPAAPYIVVPARLPNSFRTRVVRRWPEKVQGMRSSGTSTK
jgi:hypothetical protein